MRPAEDDGRWTFAIVDGRWASFQDDTECGLRRCLLFHPDEDQARRRAEREAEQHRKWLIAYTERQADRKAEEWRRMTDLDEPLSDDDFLSRLKQHDF